MRILNFGSLNIDHVYQVSHFVRPGETISSTQLKFYCGGKGLNQSIALARAKAEVYHAGNIGGDGEVLINALMKEGADTTLIKTSAQQPTGHAVIQVDDSGQNSILLFGGANHTVTKEQVDETLQYFSPGDCIVLQNEINHLAYIIEQAHEKGMKVFFNPSPCDEKIRHLPLHYVDCFLLNEVEGADIIGRQQNIMDELTTKFPNAEIVLTLGEKGVKYGKGKKRLEHRAYSVKAVDTTAAGDTFTGFFVGALSKGAAVAEALHNASVAGALAVTKAGAGESIPDLDEVQKKKQEWLDENE